MQPVEVARSNRAAATVADNVRALREQRRLSLGQLAARSGMSKGSLSKLEAAIGNPTLATLEALADGLSVELPDLLSPPVRTIEIVRAGEGLDISDGRAAATVVKAFSRDGLLIEVHDIVIEPGDQEVSATHGEGSWEHVIVRSGRVEAGPINQTAILAEGDYAVYPADRPHLWKAVGEEKTRVWVLLTIAHRI